MLSEEGTKFFQTLSDRDLGLNNEAVVRWTKYREDVELTKDMLGWLPLKLTHKVLVPIGSKALMRGKIVHTNELLVNLGDTWFVKATAPQTNDICTRRIAKCNEMLDQLEKERQLLLDKTYVPIQNEAFGSIDHPEVIEEVTEEEDEEWRKQHKVRVKEYHAKLAALRQQEKSEIKTEEDLWQHLDELELQEELEDELQRLHDHTCEDEEDDKDTEEEEETANEGYEEKDIEHSKNLSNLEGKTPLTRSTESEARSKPTARVSFDSAIDENKDQTKSLYLTFHHSSNEPKIKTTTSEIVSPSDVYDSYLQMLKDITPVSILKCSRNPNELIELEAAAMADMDRENLYCSPVGETPVPSTFQITDVVERQTTPVQGELVREPQKRISKFKASRMRK